MLWHIGHGFWNMDHIFGPPKKYWRGAPYALCYHLLLQTDAASNGSCMRVCVCVCRWH